MAILGKCKYCKGKDGKQKDIYITLQNALDAAKFIESERQIYLTPYKCPCNNGYHLTKNNATTEIDNRKKAIYQNNDIPIKSKGTIEWEYIEPETIDEDENTIEKIENRKIKTCEKQIEKIVCKNDKQTVIINGKVMEIITNVNIEKMFKVKTENIFTYHLLKPYLTGDINQITLYVQNINKTESYTILLQKEIAVKNKVKIGDMIKVNIFGKTINIVTKWVCKEILK